MNTRQDAAVEESVVLGSDAGWFTVVRDTTNADVGASCYSESTSARLRIIILVGG